MTRTVVDTSVLIDHLRGDARAVDFLISAETRKVELWSSVLVRAEIRAGMRPKERRATERLLDSLRWMDVTKEIADRAGDFANKHLRSHSAVDTVDYVIAATTVELDANLATLNVKHFPMFRSLRPPY